MNKLLAAAALVAAEIGAPLPEAPVPVVVPAPRVRAVAATPRAEAPVQSGYASGTGWLSGSAHLWCNEAPGGNGGWMSGSVHLRGDLSVNGPDGTRGTVPVSGFVHLTGSCRDGSGFVSGSAYFDGSGPLYKDGRRAGVARLSGSVFVHQHANGFVWINQYASLSGRFDADPN
jgi:hypothetical protein